MTEQQILGTVFVSWAIGIILIIGARVPFYLAWLYESPALEKYRKWKNRLTVASIAFYAFGGAFWFIATHI